MTHKKEEVRLNVSKEVAERIEQAISVFGKETVEQQIEAFLKESLKPIEGKNYNPF